MYYLKLLRASEGTLTVGPGCILQSLVPTQSALGLRGGVWPVLLVGTSLRKACAPAVRALLG
jgi:hypothetical protein